MPNHQKPPDNQTMATQSLILAIDTSCDETAAAVVYGKTVLSNVIASQAQLHQPYGGVFPTVAKQAHRENIDAVVRAALRRAQVTTADLNTVAVTIGPGLAPALEVGIAFAHQLATTLHIPLIPVNHIEGHALSALARPKSKSSESKLNKIDPFPILSLVISGGHTEFIAIHDIGRYERLGYTVDDAAGEALDKFGRLVDLGYPAGPVVEELAKMGDAKRFHFPIPMTTSGDANMSFSGLKTAARRTVTEQSSITPLTKQDIADLCASFQAAVFRAVTYKLEWLLTHHPAQFSAVYLGGGVAANATLRQALRTSLRPHHLQLQVPYTKRVCGDNAAMIGLVAGLHAARTAAPILPSSREGDGLAPPPDRRPRWPVDQVEPFDFAATYPTSYNSES